MWPLTTFADVERSFDIISFKANGATCQGFNNAATAISNFSEEQKAVFNMLRGLVTATEAETLELHLLVDELGDEGMRQLRQLRDLLPGGCEPLLPSIGVAEYSCFPSNPMVIHKPHLQMSQDRPPPLVALPASDSFTSFEEFEM